MLSRLFISIPELIAQTSNKTPPPEAYRQWSSLMLILAILSVLIVTMLWMIISLRRARRVRDALPKPKDTKHIDAWTEAGRRFDNSITEIDVEDD
jgi:beta-lactamase regulating signal transducer with metallopeptidase domain